MPAHSFSRPPPFRLTLAARCLEQGGLVAYPTEAVYGLGCDPANEQAVRRLLALKRRAATKGLILIASHFDQLRPWLGEIPAEILGKVMDTWPGPHTWVMPAHEHTPDWLTGRFDTLAVRVTDHPVAAALCERFGGAVVSTSANLSGQSPARKCRQVPLKLGRHWDWQRDCLVGGETGGMDRPTAISDARTGAIIRPG